MPLLETNKGQLEGLPKNPRFIRDNRYKALKRSIEESPEMLKLRELWVYPLENGHYVIVSGNHRYRACRDLGYEDVPCKVLPKETPVEKLREYASKENMLYAQDDMDIILNEWNKDELTDWGFEFPEEKVKDDFQERFEAVTDENAMYPLVPKYDEKHEIFIIVSSNEVDSNWLREKLGMQHMRSYKRDKKSKSNITDVAGVRSALEAK